MPVSKTDPQPASGHAAADRNGIRDIARLRRPCSERLAARRAGSWTDTAITVLALIFYAHAAVSGSR